MEAVNTFAYFVGWGYLPILAASGKHSRGLEPYILSLKLSLDLLTAVAIAPAPNAVRFGQDIIDVFLLKVWAIVQISVPSKAFVLKCAFVVRWIPEDALSKQPFGDPAARKSRRSERTQDRRPLLSVYDAAVDLGADHRHREGPVRVRLDQPEDRPLHPS